MIKIVIAEDSKVMATILQKLISEESDMEVVGVAKNGVEAVSLCKELKPHLVTMDINMPGMDGVEATKHIMQECPTPIVVISALDNEDTLNTTFNALQAGALTVVEKPKDILNAGFTEQKKSLLNTIRALSQVHVIRRRHFIKDKKEPIPVAHIPTQVNTFQLLALGSSTGGPEALNYIFSNVSAELSLPVVVVQHITNGFLPGLINWLNKKSALPIEIVQNNNQALMPGIIYFAPNNRHLIIKAGESGPLAFLEDSPEISYCKPSVTRLFSSIATAYPHRASAGLLTGMGKDGADGLLSMKEAGCHTFIQNEESAVIFGMPGAAKSLNAECDIIALNQIPGFIDNILKKG